MHRTVLPKEELSDLRPFFFFWPNFQIPFTSEPKINLHRNTMYFCRIPIFSDFPKYKTTVSIKTSLYSVLLEIY